MSISFSRSHTRQVIAGGLPIGGGAPITVQSMTNVPTTDIEAVCNQINMLANRGAEIVRVAVPDSAAAEAQGFEIPASIVAVGTDVG